MGDINQFAWIKKHKNLIKGPVLEIGSKHYSKDVSINYRSLCEGLQYIGTDMQAGNNVDVVIDFTDDLDKIRKQLNVPTIGTVICCSVLEHVNDVFKMSQNISKLMEKGSILFVSVPFSWKFHGYPSDYWRFTPEGLKYLFREFEFDHGMTSSNVNNDLQDSIADPNSFMVKGIRKDSFLEKLFLKLGLIRNDFRRYHYVLVPTMISMIGIKK